MHFLHATRTKSFSTRLWGSLNGNCTSHGNLERSIPVHLSPLQSSQSALLGCSASCSGRMLVMVLCSLHQRQMASASRRISFTITFQQSSSCFTEWLLAG